MYKLCILIITISTVINLSAHEYHVSVYGNDKNSGDYKFPFRTISMAAKYAYPGDIITVHAGIYREEINPLRGGFSDKKRIVYRAAVGEKVYIKGSEKVSNWKKYKNDTWIISIPNSFFGKFNPYSDLIHGDWFRNLGREHHTGAVYLDGFWLIEARNLKIVLAPQEKKALWFAQVKDGFTTIFAQFKGINPNDRNTEINVRRTVFYPKNTGINYITVQGFILEQAATPWSPPTAEQIGLIGTNWSKGWIIKNNIIKYSTCVGVTLGKYGDKWDNTSQNSATGYVKTINNALNNGWTKENIGHHLVFNNEISNCEQAGVVGSLGAIFSIISQNTIHHIHVRKLFSGAEIAGIKIHAAIDCTISNNHIYKTFRGIWLDWMNQGSRITKNFLHDNGPKADIFVEVNHGSFLVDYNFCLSENSLRDWSEGGAYVHNIFAGKFVISPVLKRATPYQYPHSTKIANLIPTNGGDNRFYNNILVGKASLLRYNFMKYPSFMGGNIFLKDAKPAKYEITPEIYNEFDPNIKVYEKNKKFYLSMKVDKIWKTKYSKKIITSKLLGKSKETKLPFVQPNDLPYNMSIDFLNNVQKKGDVSPGPISFKKSGRLEIKIKAGASFKPYRQNVLLIH